MFKMVSLSILLFIGIFGSFVVANEKVVVCYYGTWATYRQGNGKFNVENIDTSLCTHVVYSFVGLNTDGTVAILDPYLDLPDNWGRDNFGKFVDLKSKNPNLKTILAIGGWGEGSAKYSVVTADPYLRKTLVNSIVQTVLEHGFDGFDIDWEYPNQRDSVNGIADVENFSVFVKELKEALETYNLELSIAVAAVESSASLSYDIPEICKYADYINLMTYDLYGAWDPVTGHNAALHKGEGFENVSRKEVITADVAVEYWLSSGCPAEKLVLGIPFYGHTFTLVDPNNNGVRAPSGGVGIAGPYTATNGFIGYNEFCVLLQEGNWNVNYDEDAKVPYASQGNKWVSYDDPSSVEEKVKYAVSQGLAGAMVWSIETDDFHGLCGEEFPLLKTINRALGRSYDDASTSNPITTASSTTTQETTKTTVTASPSTSAPSTTTTPTSTEAPSSSESSTSFDSSTTTTPTSTEAPSSSESSTSFDSSTTTTPTSTEEPSSSESSTSFDSSTSTTTPASTTTAPSSSVCKKEGFASDPNNCSVFYMCVKNLNNDLEPIKFECPKTLIWDQNILACNYGDATCVA